MPISKATLLALATSVRAPLFADSVSLFVDATRKTRSDPVAPYQLGKALEATARDEEAMRAFELAIARGCTDLQEVTAADGPLNLEIAREMQRIGEETGVAFFIRDANCLRFAGALVLSGCGSDDDDSDDHRRRRGEPGHGRPPALPAGWSHDGRRRSFVEVELLPERGSQFRPFGSGHGRSGRVAEERRDGELRLVFGLEFGVGGDPREGGPAFIGREVAVDQFGDEVEVVVTHGSSL